MFGICAVTGFCEFFAVVVFDLVVFASEVFEFPDVLFWYDRQAFSVCDEISGEVIVSVMGYCSLKKRSVLFSAADLLCRFVLFCVFFVCFSVFLFFLPDNLVMTGGSCRGISLGYLALRRCFFVRYGEVIFYRRGVFLTFSVDFCAC